MVKRERQRLGWTALLLAMVSIHCGATPQGDTVTPSTAKPGKWKAPEYSVQESFARPAGLAHDPGQTGPFPTIRVPIQDGEFIGRDPGPATFDNKRQCHYVVAGAGFLNPYEVLRVGGATTRTSRVLFYPDRRLEDIHYEPSVDRLFVLASSTEVLVLDPTRQYRVVHSWPFTGKAVAMGWHQPTGRLFVAAGSDRRSASQPGTVFAYELGSEVPVAQGALSFEPSDMAIEPKSNKLYLSWYDPAVTPDSAKHRSGGRPGGVAVVDPQTLTVKVNIDVARQPQGLILDSPRQLLILELRHWPNLVVLDLKRNAVIKLLRYHHDLTGKFYDGFFDPRNSTVVLLFDNGTGSRLVRLARDGDSYLIKTQQEFPKLQGQWERHISPGPSTDQVLVTLPTANEVALVDLAKATVAKRRTGVWVTHLAANAKAHRVYALDGPGGELLFIDSRTTKILKRLRLPSKVRTLMVDEDLGIVAVVADLGYDIVVKNNRGYEKMRKRIIVYDAWGRKKLLDTEFRTHKARITYVGAYDGDPHRGRLFLIFDDAVEVFSLTNGNRTRLESPFSSPVNHPTGLTYHAQQRQLLVGGHVGGVALYDEELKLLKRSKIDLDRVCRWQLVDRKFGAFDLCEAVFSLWDMDRVTHVASGLFPVFYPNAYVVDDQQGRVLVFDDESKQSDGILIPWTLKTGQTKPPTLLHYSGQPPPGKRDYFGLDNLYRIDTTNRLILQLLRSGFKFPVRDGIAAQAKGPYNLYSLPTDSLPAELKLKPRAALQDNPRYLVFDPSVRHAFVSHELGGYLTVLRY